MREKLKLKSTERFSTTYRVHLGVKDPGFTGAQRHHQQDYDSGSHQLQARLIRLCHFSASERQNENVI